MKAVSLDDLQAFFNTLPQSQPQQILQQNTCERRTPKIPFSNETGTLKLSQDHELSSRFAALAFEKNGGFVLECAKEVAKILGWSPEFTKVAATQTFYALVCKAVCFDTLEASVPPVIDQI